MSEPHILLVEDDQRLAELMQAYLGKHGYRVSHVARGDHAEGAVAALAPDLVILDVMLPGKDGFEVCRALRPGYPGRILMMTARDEEIDEILGLELGADDYLGKPVEPRRLLARVRALLRRPSDADGQPLEANGGKLQFGPFRICATSREAHLNDAPLELTTAEFDLLWLLASSAGAILSRDDIMNALRGIGFDGLDRSIDARISRLRRKLGDDAHAPERIKTVRGKGYLFSSQWDAL